MDEKRYDVWRLAGKPLPINNIYFLRDPRLEISSTDTPNEFMMTEDIKGKALGFMDVDFKPSDSCKYILTVDPHAMDKKENGIYVFFEDIQPDDAEKQSEGILEKIYALGYVTITKEAVIVAYTQSPQVYIATYDMFKSLSMGRINKVTPVTDKNCKISLIGID